MTQSRQRHCRGTIQN